MLLVHTPACVGSDPPPCKRDPPQTAKSKLRGTLGDKVALDEDGVLQIKDEQLNAKV